MTANGTGTLGERLRESRKAKGLSLREVERRSGINSGYLSQLERNEIANPTPSVLNKVATAYSEPFVVLMRWAGYVEEDPNGLSSNAQRALSVLGDDFTEDELSAIKAVLDVIRKRGHAATFARVHRTDLELDASDLTLIRNHALGILRELDAVRGDAPVDLDEALLVAKLVRAGVIELTLEERRGLMGRFREVLVDFALNAVEGFVHLDRNEVFIKPGMHEMRKRFVLSHEIGHTVLPEHRLVFAHLDDRNRLTPDFNDRLERQANQFSIELLAKGDRMREEFDDSRPGIDRLIALGDCYGISKQATARRLAEESRLPCAVAVAPRAFKGEGRLLDQHFRLYCSRSFEETLHWKKGNAPADQIRDALRVGAAGLEVPTWLATDASGQAISLNVEVVDAHYSVIAFFHFERKRRWRPTSANSFLRGARRDPASVSGNVA